MSENDARLLPLLRCRGLIQLASCKRPNKKLIYWQIWGTPQGNLVCLVWPQGLISVQISFVKLALDLLHNYWPHLSAVAWFNEKISPPSKLLAVSLDHQQEYLQQPELKRSYKIEFFHQSQLCGDIMAHSLQPQWQLCSNSQAKRVKARHIYKMNQIRSSDIVAIWLQLVPGQVVALCDNHCKRPLDNDGKCCDNCRWKAVI